MEESKKKKILIIEDDAPLRKALVLEFIKDGSFVVFEAENGKEGLVVAFKEHPHLILLDMIMPKMNGEEVFNNLCKDEWGIGVPVIILTNLSDSKTIVENIRNGVSDYLIKSECKISDILKKVKERLGM